MLERSALPRSSRGVKLSRNLWREPRSQTAKRSGQVGRLRAAGLREIRSTAAFATDLLRHVIDDVSRFHARREVVSDAGDERHFVIACRRTQHDDCAAELVFKLIHGHAQRGSVRAIG